jgi:hypothetical protein
MKKHWLPCLAAGLLSTPALADWSPTFASGFYQGTVVYNGASQSANEAMTSNGYANGPMSALARPVYSLPHLAKTALDNEVRQLAAALPSASARYVTSSISGPVQLNLTGLTGAHAGLNQATVSGPSYSALVRATASRLGISVECDVRLSVSNVSIAVAYEPYSGSISTDPALSRAQLNPTTSASCSNSLDFIPIVGDLINGFVEREITSTAAALIESFGTTALRSVIPLGPQSLGLYNVIAPGQYVVNGLDVGTYLRDNFASYFAGHTLNITLGPENIVQSVVGVGEPARGPYVGNTLSVDLSDASKQLSFSIKDVRYFNWRYVCQPRPGAGSCIEP